MLALLHLSAAAEVLGHSCLPLDVVGLLRGETSARVMSACGNLLSAAADEAADEAAAGCNQACFEAALRFQAHHCYSSLSQPQLRQPRFRSSSHVALQGIWYGLYPASGVDLIDVTYDAATQTLRGTKLTGNQFVRAGRVSWEATPTACMVVSSMWAGAYTPRWDVCKFVQIDADHFDIALPLEGGGQEILKFARALLPTLLSWDAPNSPVFGLDYVLESCGLEIEEHPGSVSASLWRGLHHSKNTVILDQVLLLFPLLVLGGVQIRLVSSGAMLVPLALLYCGLLVLRLQYLGFI